MVVDKGKIAVVTVHGTGDTADGPDGDKWFQNGSEFSGRLQKRLSEQGVESEIIPHLWTGANSASAREKGSIALTKLVKRLAKSHEGVHVIGHSHGGNVANDAACMLNWHRGKKRPRLRTVTTVGTPFFRTIVHRSEKLGAWAFLIMVVVSLIVLALAMFFANQTTAMAEQNAAVSIAEPIEMVGGEIESAGEGIEDFVEDPEAAAQDAVGAASSARDDLIAAAVVVATVSLLAIIFIFPLAFRGIARIRRAGRKKRETPALHTIWHPNDEAIAFLQRVEALPVEVFPKWSLLKGSRTGAILWGVRAAIWTPLIGLILILLSLFGEADAEWAQHPVWAGMENVGIILFTVGLLGAPILFGIVYLGYRALVAIVLEFGLRGRLNGMVGNAVRGIALGRDGDNRVGEVSERSHYYGCDPIMLEGELAQKMLAASHDATQRLFDKYRSSLFSVGVSEDNAVAELTQDAMTWDSLIHTTYFDQPEIAVMIADRIAAQARGKPADSAQKVSEETAAQAAG